MSRQTWSVWYRFADPQARGPHNHWQRTVFGRFMTKCAARKNLRAREESELAIPECNRFEFKLRPDNV